MKNLNAGYSKNIYNWPKHHDGEPSVFCLHAYMALLHFPTTTTTALASVDICIHPLPYELQFNSCMCKKVRTCVCVCVGGDPAGRWDPVLFTEARLSRGSSAPEEAQDRSGALHDRVVHVRVLPHAAVGVSAAHLGHVLLRGLVSFTRT